MRQFPGGVPRIGGCEFVFERPRSSYDWVVVYEDLPSLESDRHPTSSSTFDCDQKNTILVTTEPASIKVYGKKYLDQFGVVLTSQEPTYISGPNVVHSQCGLQWYVGLDSKPMITWDELAARKPGGPRDDLDCLLRQNRLVRFTREAIELTREFMQAFPEADWYGKGVRPIDEKANALFPYQYHLCIENHLAKHHWTEKLADAFLGWAMPLYVGCTNASECFWIRPAFFNLDLRQPPQILKPHAKKSNLARLKDSFEAIQQSRNLVLRDYNLFFGSCGHYSISNLGRISFFRSPCSVVEPSRSGKKFQFMARWSWRLSSLGSSVSQSRLSKADDDIVSVFDAVINWSKWHQPSLSVLGSHLRLIRCRSTQRLIVACPASLV